MKLERREIKRARIEIIPMIDTIFFLLVFFMIASLSMVRMKGLDITLPRQTPLKNSVGPKLVITKSTAGQLFVGATQVTAAQLSAHVQDILNRQPDTLVIVNVAPSQPMQALVNVMDTVNALRTPSGQSVSVSIADQPVDFQGNAASPQESIKTSNLNSTAVPSIALSRKLKK